MILLGLLGVLTLRRPPVAHPLLRAHQGGSSHQRALVAVALAMKLATQVYEDEDKLFFSRHDAFIHVVEAALAAHGHPVGGLPSMWKRRAELPSKSYCILSMTARGQNTT